MQWGWEGWGEERTCSFGTCNVSESVNVHLFAQPVCCTSQEDRTGSSTAERWEEGREGVEGVRVKNIFILGGLPFFVCSSANA
jgi:hypothetical protein